DLDAVAAALDLPYIGDAAGIDRDVRHPFGGARPVDERPALDDQIVHAPHRLTPVGGTLAACVFLSRGAGLRPWPCPGCGSSWCRTPGRFPGRRGGRSPARLPARLTHASHGTSRSNPRNS